MFRDLLQSDEFRGCFSHVVFAILTNKPGEDSNLSAFIREFGSNGRILAPQLVSDDAGTAECVAGARSGQGDPRSRGVPPSRSDGQVDDSQQEIPCLASDAHASENGAALESAVRIE